MNAKAQQSLEQVRTAIDNAVKKLPKPDYRDVLEELAADIEGRLDAVKSEMAEDE